MKILAAFACGAAAMFLGLRGWLIWSYTVNNKIRYEEGEQ